MMRMLPCPHSCSFLCFHQCFIRKFLCIHQLYIALIYFRFLIHYRKYTFRTCQPGGYTYHLRVAN